MLWISSNKYRLFGRRALCTGAAIAALCAGSSYALAGPDGEIITGGTISISRIDATTTVINQSSDRGIIDWRNFDVNVNERVQFHQPSVQSITVNRVKNSTKTSEINGEIKANGNVVILNENGVMFGATSRVDVGGLVASTSDLADDNEFMNGGAVRFKPGSNPNAMIETNGSINVRDAGLVGLVAPHVENNGVITARFGRVHMAAGDTATVDFAGDGLIQLDISSTTTKQIIRQKGIISADGGHVMLTASTARDVVSSLIEVSGHISARSIGNKKGNIRIHAEGSNAVAGNVAANKGKKQGFSTVIIKDATLDTSGRNAGDKGGSIEVSADKITLASSSLDASGDAGGGSILIGGGPHGLGSTSRSLTTTIHTDVLLTADAITFGNGGTIVTWADQSNTSAGTFMARGGAFGGDGGFIETSAVGAMNFGELRVDASSSRGNAGLWLIDPQDLTIDAIGAGNIIAALNGGTSVTATTSACNASYGVCSGTVGNITLSSDIIKTAGGNATLTLNADNNIILNAAISSTAGQLAVNLNATGNVSGNSSGNINTNGGLLTINAGSGNGTLAGIISGTGGLTKQGAGTLTLTGANTYSGATTVNAGTLAADINITQSGISTSATSVASGATLRLNNLNISSTDVTVGNAFTGLGNIQVAFTTGITARNTVLNGLAGFTGNVSLSTAGGTGDKLNLGSNLAGSLTIANNTTAYMNASRTIINGVTVAGTGNSEGLGALRVDGATLTSNVVLAGDSDLGTNIGTGIINGIISGGFNINKVATGILTLSGVNTYTGTTTVSAGTLRAGVATSAFGSNSAITVASGATLDLAGFNNSIGSLAGAGTVRNGNATAATLTTGGNNTSTTFSGIIQNGTGTIALTKVGSGTLTLTGANTYTGATTISAGILQVGDGGTTGTLGTGAVSNSGGLHFNRSNALTVSNTISGTGTLTHLGTGTTTLSGVKTYTGATTVSAGTLRAGVATSAFGTNSAVTVASGAILDLAGFNNSIGSLAGAGTVTNSNATAATLTTGGNNTSTTFSGIIQNGTGTIALTKPGTGTLTLSGANTYTGTTTVSAGTIIISGQPYFNVGRTTTIASGATLQLLNSVNDFTTQMPLSTVNGAGTLRFSGNSTLNQTLGGSPNQNRFVLAQSAGGLLDLQDTSYFLNGGWQNINWTSNLGSLNIASGATFEVWDGNTVRINALTGSGTINKGNGGTVNITLGVNGGSGTFSGTISNSTGSISITKLGAGTQTFTGNNTYTGGTNINAGILNVGSAGALGSTGTISFGGGTLQHSASNTTDYSARFNTGGSQARNINTNGQNVTYASALVGTGSTLTKTGTGTLTLTGANTYTGGTNINAGIINLGSASAIGTTGTISFGGGTLQYSASNTTDYSARFNTGGSQLRNIDTNGQNVTYASVLSGAGSTLTKLGAGTLTLAITNTYTGTTTINAGTLTATSQNALGTGAVDIVNGTVNSTTVLLHNVVRYGTLTGSQTGIFQSGYGTWNSRTTAAGLYFNNNLICAGTGGTCATALTVTNGTINPFVAVGSVSSWTQSGIISGGNATSVVRIADGFSVNPLIFSAGNTYAGATDVNAGILRAGSTSAFGNNTATTVASGATLDLAGFNISIGSLAGAGTVTNSNASAVTLTAGSNNSSTTFSGIIQNSTGTITLTKVGTGTLTLTGANTYTGGTNINAGVLSLGSAGALGSSGTISFGGGTLQHSASNTTDYSARFNTGGSQARSINTNGQNVTYASALVGNGSTLTKLGTGTLTLTGANTYTGGTNINAGVLSLGSADAIGTTGTISFGGGTLQHNAINTTDYSARFNTGGSQARSINTNGQNVTYASALVGTGSTLIKLGTGTLTLTGANTYTGTTTISAGTLQIGNGGTTGTLGTGAVVNNAALAINHSDALTIANTISGTGTFTHLGTGTTTLTANNTYSGSTTISAGTLQIGNNGTTGTLGSGAVINNAALIFDRSNALTVNNSISGTGSLTKLRANILTLSGANTYSGATTVSEGTLRAATTTAFSPNSTVTVASGAVLDLAGWTNSIGSLAGAGTVTNSNVATPTLTVGNNNASTTFSGVIQNGTGAIALTKTGTGTLTLSGTNTYTGATNVNAGTLQILNASTVSNDGVLGSGAVAVASGALLRFTNSRTANDTYLITNTISGAGSLLFDGPDGSITTLSNANTYSGGTTISSGVVNIGNNAVFGTGTVTMTGGAIRATVSPRTLANAFNLNGTIGLGMSTNITGAITLSGNSTITCSANCGSSTFSGPIALGANTLSLGDIGPNTLGGVWAGNNLILSGIISGLGGITQGSSGTLTLSGANTYTGATNVNAGTLTLGANNVLANATALSVASGATFNLAGFTDTIASLNSAVGSIVTLGNGSLTTSGAQNYGGQVTGGNVTLASTGGGAITANNPTNDFTGTVNLSSTGAISLVDANALTLGTVSGSTISARTLGALSNLTLGGNLTALATSGDSIILAAGRDVDNSGNRTLTTAGTARWLIYSGDTANTTQSNGGLTGFNRYGCTYNAGSPSCAGGTNTPATGNGFYYAFAPTLTITPSALATLTYGDAVPSLVGYIYGVSGYLAGDSALDTLSGSLTGATTYTPTSNVGIYNINYDSGTLDSALGYVFNYANNPTAITVNKASLVATANGQTITYGATVPNSTITYTGFVNGENDSVIDMLATLNSTNSGIINAGNYVGNYTASGALDNNYNFTYVAGNLLVNKASLVATANGQTITYGATVPNSTITYTGFVNGENDSVIDMLATLNSTNSGIINAGNYVGNYTASGALDNNYNFTYVAGNLLVNAGSSTPPTNNPPPTTNSLPPTVERVVQDAVQVVSSGSATSSGAGNVNVVVQDKGFDGKDIVVLDDREIKTIQDGNPNNNNALIIVSKQFLQALDDRVARELNHLNPRENRPIAL